MARYFRRTRGGRYRRGRRVKKWQAYSKTGKKAQSRQIYKLQRQVDSVRRKTRSNTQWCQYNLRRNTEEITHGIAPENTWQPYVWDLIDPSQWNAVFQTNSTLQVQSKISMRSIGIEYMVQQTQTGDFDRTLVPVTCTIFFVKLRKESAKQFLEDTNNGQTLSQGIHFTASDMGTIQGDGMVMLNKGIFKIIHTDRFMLGGLTSYATMESKTKDLKDNNHRRYVKLSYPNTIKSGTTNPWKNLVSSQLEPTDRIFMYMFHNAYGIVGEEMKVAFNAQAIFTGRATL